MSPPDNALFSIIVNVADHRGLRVGERRHGCLRRTGKTSGQLLKLLRAIGRTHMTWVPGEFWVFLQILLRLTWWYDPSFVS